MSDLVRVEGWLATSGPLRGHPTFTIPPEVIEILAERVRAGLLPMQLDHDDRTRVDVRVLSAEVREVKPGIIGVWAAYEMPEGAAGERTGFSISLSMPLGSRGTGGLAVTLAADALHFQPELTLAAADELSEAFPVVAGALYQLNVDPPAKVILVFALTHLKAFAIGAARTAIIKALRKFMRVGSATEFRFMIEKPDGSKVNALLKTDKQEVVERAIDAFENIALDADVLEYDDETGSYRPLSRSQHNDVLEPPEPPALERGPGD